MEFITHWIETNPEYSGLVVFIITFVETFAFIGALVPGVVILFAVSALIGSSQSFGLLPLVLVAGVSTAMSNILSFYWGYALRHRIESIPFFQRHQTVLNKSSELFDRWGPLSIATGRFIGPIRPFVAFAAGTLSFPPKRFIIFDSLAVLIWAPVYIVPGYLAGMAVEGFMPSWEKWPPLFLLSAASTFALIAFIAGNFWLQSNKPKAQQFANKIGVDELPLASTILLILVLAIQWAITSPLPIDDAIMIGFQKILQPWGYVAAVAALLLADPTLLLLQTIIIVLYTLLTRQFRLALLITTIGFFILLPLHNIQWIQHPISYGIASFTILLGSITAIFCESIRPTRRWFFYLLAILVIFIHSTANLALGIYSLSLVVNSLLFAIAVTAVIRIGYSFLRIKNYQYSAAFWPVFCLLLLLTMSSVASNLLLKSA